MSTDGQTPEQWKQKYYDQLDRLEQKEQDWEKLENTLKRTIGRLSLAAEGQHPRLDRHIGDLRTAIKNNINRQKLDVIVDDISKIITQLEEKQNSPNRAAVAALEDLLKQLDVPANCTKAHKKLLKQFSKADDENRDSLLKDSIALLKQAIAYDPAQEPEKSGLLNRLFTSDKSSVTPAPSAGSETQDLLAPDIQAITRVLAQLLSILPWPEKIKAQAEKAIQQIQQADNDNTLQTKLAVLETVIHDWPIAMQQPGENTAAPTHISSSAPSSLDTYKNCLINFMNDLDDTDNPSGQLTALKIIARDAKQESELTSLSKQLSQLLSEQTTAQSDSTDDVLVDTSNIVHSTVTDKADAPIAYEGKDTSLQPSIQELLIRLLEQLIVPADLQADVDKMKQRLEKDTQPDNWKKLLKDVALLINSIRSRMQQEKHEFETFLQQVTDRLKSMDQFLQIETNNLQEAQDRGEAFDEKFTSNVNDIRQDVDQAVELDNLKLNVNAKLDTISSHIVNYREYETHRVQESQQQVYNMQTRMLSLEKETETLKKVVIEKNKQAMFDALTDIPNRLSYEKRIVEEVSRWKRFNTPLSLAVWDIDFFKKVNDSYGHKAGDKVLKTVAQLLNKRIRTTDFLARYGGEEFVMLLPGTKQEETLRLVNDLRQQVESCGFHYHGEAVTITVSCGISSFQEGDSIEKVFERADQALYKAKENGRNQCVIAACLSD